MVISRDFGLDSVLYYATSILTPLTTQPNLRLCRMSSVVICLTHFPLDIITGVTLPTCRESKRVVSVLW